MKSGLVSVTFRKKTPEEIITLCQKAELEGIEWGADVHAVSPEAARKIRGLMGSLEVFSLGSYYRLGEGQDFGPILSTAEELEAPNIRIWAGTREPKDVSDDERKRMVEEARSIAELTQNKGITISFEYHGGTLTCRQSDAVALMNEINHPNIRIYWQPLPENAEDQRSAHIIELGKKGWLENIHVFQWKGLERFPLEEGFSHWKEWICSASPYARNALLEFVRDDSEEQFLKDAAVLKSIISEVEHE